MIDPTAPISRYAAGEPYWLVSAAGTAGGAREAVALLGGRLLGRVDWMDAVAALERVAARAVVILTAEGVGAATLETVLPALAEATAARGLAVVASFDEDQLDLVAAHLFGPSVQLLCDPSGADLVSALAVAVEMMRVPALGDTWRESEAARLRRLNEEVARIAEILARLTRSDPAADVEDRRRGFDAGPAREAAIDPADVRRIIRLRRLRDQFFGAGLFEDPAWDMLLDLYAAELEQVRVSVSSLCIAAAVAPTTALRWITKMTEAGLFVRRPDPLDRRRAFMALSPRASEAMRGYMVATQHMDPGG